MRRGCKSSPRWEQPSLIARKGGGGDGVTCRTFAKGVRPPGALKSVSEAARHRLVDWEERKRFDEPVSGSV